MDHRTGLDRVLVVLIGLSVAVTFTSWGTSGSVGRSSYELVDSSRALGLLDAGVARIAPAWFALPFLAAGSVIALAMGRRRIAGLLAAMVGAAMVVAAIVVKSSPVGVDTGAVAGALLGAATIVVGAALYIPERSDRRDRRSIDRPDPVGASRAGGADHRPSNAAPASSAGASTPAPGGSVDRHH